MVGFARPLDCGASLRPDQNVMNDVSMERVLAFNKELVALSAAGLPIEIGEKTEPLEEVLDRVNANLRLRTELGQSVADAVQDNEELPQVYRDAVQTGLLGNSPAVVLDSISSRWQARDELRRTAGYSMVQPLILLTLSYFGFIFLCLYFSPPLEGIYEQMRRDPSTSVSILRTARAWMPLWAPLMPVLLIAAIFLWRRGRQTSQTWIPFSGSQLTALRNATFADQLAALLTHGVSLPEGLRLAGGVTGDADLIETTEALAQSAERGEKLPADPRQLRSMPPLLRWALTGDLGGQPLPDILSFAADTYRQSAQHQAAICRIALPTLLGAFLGGVVVFVYGFFVFGPYARLLKDLSI